jgi:hypothetical protein
MTTTTTDIDPDELRLAKRARPPRVKYPTNEEFAALTPAQKRVAVAQDVLLWLRTKKLLPRAGTYLKVLEPATAPVRDYLTDIHIPTSTVVKVNGNSCHACALGSVFAAYAERGAANIGDAWLSRGFDTFAQAMHSKLGDVFSSEQLTLIECAFERSSCFEYAGGEELSGEAKDAAAQFGWRVARSVPDFEWDETGDYSDAEFAHERQVDARVLRAIMNNIIDNGGTFIP